MYVRSVSGSNGVFSMCGRRKTLIGIWVTV